MEKLKSAVPETLKQQIAGTERDDLPLTCSALLDFFHRLPLFHQIVGDLTNPEKALCGKNKDAALEAKRQGNECFSGGDYSNALRFYSQALRVAPTNAAVDDTEKDLVATLYLNRASALHKMCFLVEGLRDCGRALMISPNYAKAWFRRGKLNASLGNYEEAIRDWSVSRRMERTASGKRQIENELKTIVEQSNQKEGAAEKLSQTNLEYPYEPREIQLQCVGTPTKGRGMISLTDIPQSALIHQEDPYAAIILKHCRDTHCHFCFNELPLDMVPCGSCTISLYCSELCQTQAGGPKLRKDSTVRLIHEKLSEDLENHISEVTSVAAVPCSHITDVSDHRHECQGQHWPMILPSEVVLACRILVKYVEEHKLPIAASNCMSLMELFENYAQLPSESKLELHVHAIIMLCCLQHFYSSALPITEVTVAQCVVLLSQIRVNSMAIVRMKVSNENDSLNQCTEVSSGGDGLVGSVQQVRVATAVYSTGSLFNHSCQPNIHAYFLSRTLYIRATEFVAAGSHLELSYGPQVGQWDCKERQRFLEDRYSFSCQCTGCSQVNLSDLVLNAYHCVKPNCFGTILDKYAAECENQKLNHLHEVPPSCRSKFGKKVEMLGDDDISKVAHNLFEQTCCAHKFEAGYCLSCDSFLDLEASSASKKNLWSYFRRLQNAVAAGEVPHNVLSDALKAFSSLSMMLHPYNKQIAEAEDNLAQAFCLVGDLQAAVHHCQASIEILEKLYGSNHIVIGNELMKLSSILLLMEESSAADRIKQMATIYSRYYGRHADLVFPHLQYLIREGKKFEKRILSNHII